MNDPSHDNNIYMSAPVDLNNKLPGGIGLRQAVLVGAAVAQALFLVFAFDSLPFAVRLFIAMCIAFVLLALAVLRPKGKSPEGLFRRFLMWLLQPRYRTHQTAARQDRRLHTAEEVVGADQASRARTPIEFPLEWDRANLALVLFMFMALLTLSTTLMWWANHGRLPLTHLK